MYGVTFISICIIHTSGGNSFREASLDMRHYNHE
jgi:hypothetical protein